MACFSFDFYKGLEGLSQLEELDLSSCENLGAQEFLKIQDQCPNLKKLSLMDTKIDSLEGLEGLSQLEELILYNSPVSQEQSAAFKRAHPSIDILAS